MRQPSQWGDVFVGAGKGQVFEYKPDGTLVQKLSSGKKRGTDWIGLAAAQKMLTTLRSPERFESRYEHEDTATDLAAVGGMAFARREVAGLTIYGEATQGGLPTGTPEPAFLILLGTGLIGIGVIKRHAKHRS